jgi:hypothetical protein
LWGFGKKIHAEPRAAFDETQRVGRMERAGHRFIAAAQAPQTGVSAPHIDRLAGAQCDAPQCIRDRCGVVAAQCHHHALRRKDAVQQIVFDFLR